MDSADVLEIVQACGLSTEGAVVAPLTGGVSCDTYSVETSSGSLVVKQALGELRVTELWQSDPGRVVAEAEGLRWFHQLSPDNVPEPIAVVEDRNAVILPRAPQPSPDLREVLLERPSHATAALGGKIGRLMAHWHTANPEKAGGTALDDQSRLISLRVDPFYRDMRSRWPQYEATISNAIEELLDGSYAVIHGDFTPKNMLSVGEGFWVIDTETAHIGHPVLDTASLLAHLLLKEVHHQDNEQNRGFVRAFRRAVVEAARRSVMSFPPSLGAHIGIIIGVRVDGRSRAPYLTGPGKNQARAVARALLEGAGIDEAMA